MMSSGSESESDVSPGRPAAGRASLRAVRVRAAGFYRDSWQPGESARRLRPLNSRPHCGNPRRAGTLLRGRGPGGQ
eukprot:623133-Hanusia_phi.AAC.2